MPGLLPSVARAAAAGFGRVVVPRENAAEALLVPAMEVVSAPSPGAPVGWRHRMAGISRWASGDRQVGTRRDDSAAAGV